MKNEIKNQGVGFFENFAGRVTKVTGSTSAFIIAFLMVIIWGVTGPVFHYSDSWQMVINTGTTIITFLMVFLIKKSAEQRLACHPTETERTCCCSRICKQ